MLMCLEYLGEVVASLGFGAEIDVVWEERSTYVRRHSTLGRFSRKAAVLHEAEWVLGNSRDASFRASFCPITCLTLKPESLVQSLALGCESLT